MISISVLSLKGGVGKTSVALGLAGAAAKRGLSVLLVDLDPQGNATSILQARHGRHHAATLLAHPTSDSMLKAISKTAWAFKQGRVDVVASDPDLIRFDSWTGTRAFTPKLARALKRLEGYDVVIMGADKWEQVKDPRYYADDVARDDAVRRLPEVALAPRPPVNIPIGMALHLPDHFGEVSSSAVRAGHAHWMLPEAAEFDRLTGAWSDTERYLRLPTGR